MSHRRTLLLALLLLPLAAATLAVVLVDWRALAVRQAEARLGREVRLEALELGWQGGPRVELHGLRIGGPDWGTAPALMEAERLEAMLRFWPLFQGRLVLHRAEAVAPRFWLERGPERRGNWEMGGTGGLSLEPLILDLRLRDGAVRYRTSSGRWLDITLDQLSLAAEAVDRPLTLRAEGGYQGTPVTLEAIFPDTTAPYRGSDGIRVEGRVEGATVRLQGRIWEPLAFDRIEARLTLEARSLRGLLALGGGGMPGIAALPARLDGRAWRQGPNWALEEASGQIGQDRLTGSLELEESEPGGADRIGLRVDFATLHPRELAGGGAGSWSDAGIALDDPQLRLEARLRAEEVVLTTPVARQVRAELRLDREGLQVRDLAARVAQGELRGGGTLRPAGTGGAMDVALDLLALDLAALARLLEAEAPPLAGRIGGGLRLRGEAATLGAALGRAEGHALLVVGEGSLSRALLQRASLNLRSLLGDAAEGTVALRCVLAAGRVQQGLLRVAPLRLRSAEGNLSGGGTVALPELRLDLLLAGESSSTGLLALDLPVRVQGRPGSLETGLGSAAALREVRRRTLPAGMPEPLGQIAQGSPCLAGG